MKTKPTIGMKKVLAKLHEMFSDIPLEITGSRRGYVSVGNELFTLEFYCHKKNDVWEFSGCTYPSGETWYKLCKIKSE